MIKLVLNEVVEALGGRVRGETPTVSVRGVSTDSRTVGAGELFFALSGPRFDGHDFVVDALRQGAAAAVIAESDAGKLERALADVREPESLHGVLIAVDDPLAALGRLAEYHRRQLPASVIAVVGSNGKTTTKAMIDHILSARLPGRSSPKSFNNAIGVPLTLLSAETSDDYLVVEIGTNAPGEVVRLAALARPDMAVLTCLAEEHLEGLGDLNGVAAEECSIFQALREGGFAAVNIDAPQVRGHLPKQGVSVATFGRDADADLRVTRTRHRAPWLYFELNGRFAYRLRLPGAHNALNAAGAITIARRLAFEHDEIAQWLQSFTPLPMRGETVQVGGVTLVNDAYNANPHSTLAAIELLESLSTGGRRILVFGEMRELGPHSTELHHKVAQRLRESRLHHVVLVGAAGGMMYEALSGGGLFGPSVDRCESVAECVDCLVELLRDDDVVLLKASRAVGLERLVELLRARLTAAPVA